MLWLFKESLEMLFNTSTIYLIFNLFGEIEIRKYLVSQVNFYFIHLIFAVLVGKLFK